MLQTKTIDAGTLSLLKKIMTLPELNSFILAGGTALSLYYGHRRSIDLDLFSTEVFDNETIISILETNFSNFSYLQRNNPIGVFGYIDDVKVDLIKHPHKLIDKSTLFEGVRLFSQPDIIAMKVNAIMKRGAKKDFWDIAELLQHYTVDNFIEFYTTKYPNQQLLISIPQALTYFEDAEESEEPISLKGQNWDGVKRAIQQKIDTFLR
jgi:predicted nucleotidyltransferase component of viral defense system